MVQNIWSVNHMMTLEFKGLIRPCVLRDHKFGKLSPVANLRSKIKLKYGNLYSYNRTNYITLPRKTASKSDHEFSSYRQISYSKSTKIALEVKCDVNNYV